MDREQIRQRSRETWDRQAAGWESGRAQLRDAFGPIYESLLDAVDLQPGQTILELAAGPGEMGLMAAPRLAPEGKVIITDFSGEMVAAARRQADELGFANVEFRQMDAEQMDLPDDSVDGVICSFGYMLMPDVEVAFAETRRVLRPGGRLSFAVWAEMTRNAWAAVGGMALAEHGHIQPPEPGAPGPFTMADRDRIAALLEGAGFGAPRIEEAGVAWPFADLDDYEQFLRQFSASMSEALVGLDSGARARVRASMDRNAEPFGTGEGYVFPGVALTVLASYANPLDRS
jgi:SAM-dependent methyltransferase